MLEQLVLEGYKKKTICRVLQINRAEYYRKKSGRKNLRKATVQEERKRKREILLKQIQQIKSEHPFWGYRRIRAYLHNKIKIKVSQKIIYQLMKENNLLVNVKHYKAKRTSQKEKIKAEKPKMVWGTDMTKFYIDSVGWLYFVVVIDWYTKKIVGWDLSLRSKAEQWINALNQAVDKELTEGSRLYNLIIVSGNGSQPTSIKYENNCNILGIRHITTAYSNPKGNADTERLFRTFKEEVVWINYFDKLEDARISVENFITFYNNDYPHSTLGYISPVDFEKQYFLQMVA